MKHSDHIISIIPAVDGFTVALNVTLGAVTASGIGTAATPQLARDAAVEEALARIRGAAVPTQDAQRLSKGRAALKKAYGEALVRVPEERHPDLKALYEADPQDDVTKMLATHKQLTDFR